MRVDVQADGLARFRKLIEGGQRNEYPVADPLNVNNYMAHGLMGKNASDACNHLTNSQKKFGRPRKKFRRQGAPIV